MWKGYKNGPSIGANSVQTSTGHQPTIPIRRDIVPPIQILVKSRLKPTRCNACTNANCILTESWGCGEAKNVVCQPVQRAYKLLRATKPILPIHRGIASPMEFLVISRLKPTRCIDCTNANCISTESWGCGEVTKSGASIGANSVPTSTGHQTHPSHSPWYSSADGNTR